MAIVSWVRSARSGPRVCRVQLDPSDRFGGDAEPVECDREPSRPDVGQPTERERDVDAVCGADDPARLSRSDHRELDRELGLAEPCAQRSEYPSVESGLELRAGAPKPSVPGSQAPGPDGGGGGLQPLGQTATGCEQPQGLLLGPPVRPAVVEPEPVEFEVEGVGWAA